MYGPPKHDQKENFWNILKEKLSQKLPPNFQHFLIGDLNIHSSSSSSSRPTTSCLYLKDLKRHSALTKRQRQKGTTNKGKREMGEKPGCVSPPD